MPCARMLSSADEVMCLLVFSLNSTPLANISKVGVAWRLPSHLEGSGLPVLIQASE